VFVELSSSSFCSEEDEDEDEEDEDEEEDEEEDEDEDKGARDANEERPKHAGSGQNVCENTL
jgi:hypothetical protein